MFNTKGWMNTYQNERNILLCRHMNDLGVGQIYGYLVGKLKNTFKMILKWMIIMCGEI